MKRKKNQRRLPPAFPIHAVKADPAAVSLDHLGQMRMQLTVQIDIARKNISFQIQVKTQRIEITGADRRPFVINYGNLAVKRVTEVFVYLNTMSQQVAIEQRAQHSGVLFVRLALQYDNDPDAPSRGIAQTAQQAIAWKEIGVGQHNSFVSVLYTLQILLLNISAIPSIIAQGK